MITIPTGEFVGLLSDVVPFACPDDDLPSLNCVQLEWDGKVLHALATDSMRVAWSQWCPDDDPGPGEEVQESLFQQWGGEPGEEPWKVLLPLDDVKHLVKTYKLPVKEIWTPLTVAVVWRADLVGQLEVERSGDAHAAITTVVDGVSVDFPDVRKVLSQQDVAHPVKRVAFTARLLADFAKVRPRGPFELTFTGEKTVAHVAIGERFVGAIVPVRPQQEEPSPLATASGVHLSKP